MEVISNIETEQEYLFDGILETEIERSDFSLTKENNFKSDIIAKARNFFSRENILKFGIMTGEIAIPTETTSGTAVISALDTKQIKERIKTFPEEKRKKIAFIHISTLQIILKSTFMAGVDLPLEISLQDARIKNPAQARIAEGSCNLKYKKVKFDINLQIGLSLKDKDLDRSIIFGYRLKNPDFMTKGNHPFTISYRINYALSNSHHSIEFKNKDRIYIDELFSPLVQLESPVLRQLERSNSIMTNPRLESSIPALGMKPESSLAIRPPRKDFESSSDKEVAKLQEDIKNLSTQIRQIDQRI